MSISTLEKLQIGFMDSISLNARRVYILSETPVSEVLKQYRNEHAHYVEACDTLDWLEKGSGKIIWYGDVNYPNFQPVLRRLPYFLLYKGTFLNKSEPSIAIVGTRHVDNEGFQASFKLGLEAAANRISVVSGLAEGCDQAALYGATIGDYPSFGVLGCGLEIGYPKHSFELKSKMIETGGAVISRFAPNSQPMRFNFPNRNLIIAAMGDASIVVQAPKKSGSLITADMALQMGKDVCVSKAGVGSYWTRVGSNGLYEDGALVLDSLSDYVSCPYIAVESKNDKDIRFGNKHYCLRSLN